jgi:hypothetical protein
LQVHLLETKDSSTVAGTAADSNSLQQLLRCQARLMGLAPQALSRLDQLFLKPKLSTNLTLAQNKFQLSQLFQELMSLFSVYKDVYWSERTHETGEQLRWSYT